MKLEQRAQQQDQMIQDVNIKAMELIEKQNQMAQGLLEQKQEAFAVPEGFSDAVSELQMDMEEADEEELGEKIKNWIEKA